MFAQVTPSEISFDWVYMPPFMIVFVLGYVLAFVVAQILNVTTLSKYFWRPDVAFLAIWVLFASLIGLFVLPP